MGRARVVSAVAHVGMAQPSEEWVRNLEDEGRRRDPARANTSLAMSGVELGEQP